MPDMTDPANALTSFQEAFARGEITLRPGVLDPTLLLTVDMSNGVVRFTHVRIDEGTVIAMVLFIEGEQVDGAPCLELGYAVHPGYRNLGRGKEIVEAAIAEMKHGLLRPDQEAFYLEAVVGIDNVPSQRIAAQLLSPSPVERTDMVSGRPALQYLRKIEWDAPG